MPGDDYAGEGVEIIPPHPLSPIHQLWAVASEISK
jgi:hypothetical protein